MSSLIEYKLESDPTVKIRVECEKPPATSDQVQRTKRGGDWVVDEAKQTFAKALDDVKALCVDAIGVFGTMEPPPKTLSIKFGFLAEASGSLKIVKGTAAANFEVTLLWEPKP
ncbi:MAG: CU044_2847 family protein [Candidatus Heimdallarchaeota archaeon]